MIEKTTARVDRAIATLQAKLQQQIARKQRIEQRNSDAAKHQRVRDFCKQLTDQLISMRDSDKVIARIKVVLKIETDKQGVTNENI